MPQEMGSWAEPGLGPLTRFSTRYFLGPGTLAQDEVTQSREQKSQNQEP